MLKLEDSQIWESARGIIQIQKMGRNCFDFRGIIFEKRKDGTLNFANILYNEKNRLVDFIEGLEMKKVTKKIIAKQKENSHGTNLGK